MIKPIPFYISLIPFTLFSMAFIQNASMLQLSSCARVLARTKYAKITESIHFCAEYYYA